MALNWPKAVPDSGWSVSQGRQRGYQVRGGEQKENGSERGLSSGVEFRGNFLGR